MAFITSLTNSDGVTQTVDQTSVTAVHNLGDIWAGDHRRIYAYVQAGAAIASGGLTLTVDEDELEKEDADTGAALAEFHGNSYAPTAQLTDGSGVPWAFTTSAYKGWMGIVDDGTEKGQAFEVEDNSATVLYLKNPIATALTSGDNDIEVFNPNRVITAPTGGGGNVKTSPCGIANSAITDEYYFWMQIGGPCLVKVAGTTNTVGIQVGLSGVDNGAGICAIAGTDKDADDFNPVGRIIRGGQTDDAKVWVFLTGLM